MLTEPVRTNLAKRCKANSNINQRNKEFSRINCKGSILLTFVLLLHWKGRKEPDQHGQTNSLVETGVQGMMLKGTLAYRGAAVDPIFPSWLFRKLLSAGLSLPDLPLVYDINNLVIDSAAKGSVCLNTSTRPSMPICVYKPEEDRYVSAQLLSEGVWEPAITRLFQAALRHYPKSLVVDLGANIGFYTLLAVAMNHRVLAVEPMWDSIVRLHRAARLAGNASASKITLIPRAISDMHKLVALRYKKGNKGGTSVRPVTHDEIPAILKKDKHGIVKTLTIDDLSTIANNTSLTVILKLDIEGCECKALAASHQFFDTHFVAYVFMEWETMFRNRYRYGASCGPSQLQASVMNLFRQGYQPFSVKNGHALDPKQSLTNWRLGDVVWRHHNAQKLPIER